MAYIGVQPADKYTSFAVQHFTTSATTSYTLDNSVANENEIALFINNVRQEPGSSYAYTASGTALTLSAATSASDTMYCVFIGKAVQTVTPANGSVTNDMLSGSIATSKLANQNIGFRNLIINGDMSIAQRGTSFTGQTSGAYYLDRFKTDISGLGTWTITQSTDVPTGQGFNKSMKFDCTTADASPSAGDFLYLNQPIEGYNTQSFKFGTANAESLTLSFWVKSNKTGTYIVRFYDIDNGRALSQSYTISSASTWEKKTITISGDTVSGPNYDNGYAFAINWCLGAGTTYTSGTLNTSWNSVTSADQFVGQVNLADSTSNEWYITGVQLEVGTSSSDFEFLPYDVNLQRCKRYLQYVCGNSNIGELTGGFRATGSAQCGMQFTTPMRTAPSVSLVGLRLHDLNDGDNLDVTSIGVVNGSSSNGTWLSMNNSGTGTVAGVCILYGYNASPTSGVQSYGIKVDAEL